MISGASGPSKSVAKGTSITIVAAGTYSDQDDVSIPHCHTLVGPIGANQGLAIDPLGRFAYATNATGNNIQTVSIDPSEGTLTEIGGWPYSTGVFPIAAAMDTTGRFLYVVNRDSNTISGYVLNRETGELTAMGGQTFPTGAKPVAILISGTMQ